VVFGSYDAPILEEEFDNTYYETFLHIPGAGNYGDYTDYDGTEISIDGLGLMPYFMWNVTGGMYSNVFYGANFVDYVGYVSDKLTMIRPVNGKGYDSYIYGQYFDLAIDGAQAPDKNTMAAIAAINALPERVGYGDKALVEAARAAYDKIATYEQMAQVTNYAALVSAEQRIIALTPVDENAQTVDPTAETTVPEETKELPSEKTEGGNGGGVLVLVLTVLALAALGLGYCLKKTHQENAWPYFKSQCGKVWNGLKDGCVSGWKAMKVKLEQKKAAKAAAAAEKKAAEEKSDAATEATEE
jgi:hypothetical protein